MDTKWRSRGKLFLWILIFCAGLQGVLLGLNKLPSYIGHDFFDTDTYDGHVDDMERMLNTFVIGGAEEAKQRITVDEEEIEEHRYRYGSLASQIDSIKNQYAQKIDEAKDAEKQDVVDLYVSERDQKIKDITENFKSDEYIEKKIRAAKEEEINKFFKSMKKYEPSFKKYQKIFAYTITDPETVKVYSNYDSGGEEPGKLPEKDMLHVSTYPEIADRGGTVYLEHDSSPSELAAEEVPADFIPYFDERGLEGEIGLLKTAPLSSSVMQDYEYYKQNERKIWVIASIGLMLLAGSFYLIRKQHYLQKLSDKGAAQLYSSLPLDVRVLGFIAALGLFVLFLQYNPFDTLVEQEMMVIYWQDFAVMLLITAGLASAALLQGKWLADTFKDEKAVKEQLEHALFHRLKELFIDRSIAVQAILLVIIMFLSGFGFAVVAWEPSAIIVYIPLFLIVTVPALIFMLTKAGEFNKAVRYAEEIKQGHQAADLRVKGKSAVARLAGSLNTLKAGMKTSQNEQAKSERLKTELITNVSHDLRTPLTSIITYAELLKTPNLSDEEQLAYTEVIDRKSKRLKVLIDDLFEASKMASGNIELMKARADIVQLLQQSLAEHNEAITQSGLQFRISLPEKEMLAVVDGQKLWRVFDNLLGNILKYSLENTRVYISLVQENGMAVITFKNVTKYELGDNIDEMFERFKRGDQSRHTEGSGLGLAIAKSIMDLHNGSLEIDVDGDLFKAAVSIELIK